MESIIIAIEPIHAKNIFNDVKRYEFRRKLPTKAFNRVILYANWPTSAIVGEFEVLGIITKPLDMLWEETRRYAGIDKPHFIRYFERMTEGNAIQIINPTRYDSAIKLKGTGIKPPQNFIYLNDKYHDLLYNNSKSQG